jgi:glycosyltransferase involved in cell wall biosynthesis
VSRPDVAIVAPYPAGQERHGGPSGVASYTANLSRALAVRGATVHVVAPRDPGAVRHETHGSITVERPFDRGPLALVRACDAALRSGARIVHVQHEHFLYGGPSSVPALLPSLQRLRRAGLGPVVTMHQVVEPAVIDRSYTQLHRVSVHPQLARVGLTTLQRSISRRAGACIVHERRFAHSVPGAVVIPHGVEEACTDSRHDARRHLGIDGDRLVVLCFGFVAPYKGLELALDAARIAEADVQLVVAGGEHPRLAGRDGYAAGLRSAHSHARFTGYVPDGEVGLWFRAADVALLTHPKPHGSSGALALAIANGTPLLMSKGMADTTGAPDDLIAPGDPTALADRLRVLAENESERDALRIAGAPLGLERSWHDVADAHLALYEEVSACPWP